MNPTGTNKPRAKHGLLGMTEQRAKEVVLANNGRLWVYRGTTRVAEFNEDGDFLVRVQIGGNGKVVKVTGC